MRKRSTGRGTTALSDRRYSFGIGRHNAERVEHEVFDSPLWDEAGTAHLKKIAAEQLGTVESGNHYVDLFEDEDGFVWIGVHLGLRGLGHRTATHFLKLAGGKDGMMVDPTVVPVASELRQRYFAGMELAGLYPLRAASGWWSACAGLSAGR